MVAPEAACANLQRLASAGRRRRATASTRRSTTRRRGVPRGQTKARGALVHGAPPGHEPARARARCCSTSRCSGASRPTRALQATLLLLQERVPTDARRSCPTPTRSAGRRSAARARDRDAAARVHRPRRAAPEVQLLSNGRYHVMVTQRRRRLQPLEGPGRHALARGRHARRLGQLLLPARRRQRRVLVDRAPADAAQAPTDYEAIFTEGRAEFRRRDARHRHAHRDRRLARGRHRAAPHPHHQPAAARAHDRGHQLLPRWCWRRRADALHPAFSKLFVQTEILERPPAVLCTRRAARAGGCDAVDVPPDGGARARGDGDVSAGRSHETDRARFIGRGRTLRAPAAMVERGPLSNSAGLGARPDRGEPLRASTLEPDQTVTVDLVTGVGRRRATTAWR